MRLILLLCLFYNEKTEVHQNVASPGSDKSSRASTQTQSTDPRGSTCDCNIVPSLKHDTYALWILKRSPLLLSPGTYHLISTLFNSNLFIYVSQKRINEKIYSVGALHLEVFQKVISLDNRCKMFKIFIKLINLHSHYKKKNLGATANYWALYFCL